MKRILLLIIALVIAVTVVHCQDRPHLVTDRPYETANPQITSRGALQLETGLAYEKDQKNNVRISNFAYNTALVRFGISDYLELRLISDYVGQRIHSRENIETKSTGFTPLLIGAKINLFGQMGTWPQAAFVGHINVTSGSRSLGTKYPVCDFRFIGAHWVGEKSILTYNLGVEWDGKTPDAALLYTLSFMYDLADVIGVYIESCSFFPEQTKAYNRAAIGLVYKLSRKTEWDISAGCGLTGDAPDSYVRTGISVRLFK